MKHSLKYITLKILVLSQNWNYLKEDAELMIPKIKQYYSQHDPFGNRSQGVFPMNALAYWLGIPDTHQCMPLKKLAITIYEIVPHAAGVEGLSSIMSASKKKHCNEILPITLKMLSQVKLHLKQVEPQINQRHNQNLQNTSNNTSFDDMCGYSFFASPLDLEASEDGVFSNVDMELIPRQEAFMDSIFNFDLWEEANQQSSSQNSNSTNLELATEP
ncbi:hypothetical protein O181_034536 [Austropuccinia psidii MF-1]|uniref:Uncharacterized protein n=1 Tax=Austropuccinia psidii MF-1 TaxID=1389203 RepID=A0A9Q3D0W5_9BASI|nr:hypothetical protein [Austropuccinia psidii MF-1]